MLFLETFLKQLWLLSAEASLYLLFGFAVATLLHAFLPTESLVSLLGRGKWRPTVSAALIGIPLPLCSCSVVPTAVAIREKGASPGATLSFLISTPETGVDSILLTYGMMGPFGLILAIARPLAAATTAIIAGLTLDSLGSDPDVRKETNSSSDNANTHESHEVESCGSPDDPATSTCCSMGIAEEETLIRIAETSCCDESVNQNPVQDGQTSINHHMTGRLGLLLHRMKTSFYLLFDEVSWFIVLGLGVSALIATFIPDDFNFSDKVGGQFFEMAMAAFFGLPMYVCATASTPIAAVLIAKGLSPGAALVFLLVGPATNIGTVALVRKLLGNVAVLSYLTSIVVVSLAAGWVVNGLCQDILIDFSSISHDHKLSNLGHIGAILLWILLGWRSWKVHRHSMRQKT